MSLSTVKNSLLFLPLLLIFTSCTAVRLIMSTDLHRPDFSYIRHEVGEPQLTYVRGSLQLNAYNPNTIGLKNVYVNYTLFIQEHRFASGKEIELKLAPGVDTPIIIPFEVKYVDAFKSVGSVAEKVIRRKKSFPMTIRVTIYGKPTIYNDIEEGGLFSFEFQYSKTIDVPIPHKDIDRAVDQAGDAVKKRLDKLF